MWTTTGPEWTLRQTVPLDDPAWLVHDARHSRLWALRGDGTTATALDIATDGSLTPKLAIDLEGTNPVHGAVDPTGRWLITANHNTGSLSVVDLNVEPPRLSSVVYLAPHEFGTHVEQDGTHPHQIVFDPTKKWVLIPDKGSDTIRVGRFVDDALVIEDRLTIRVRSGSGPRHLAFVTGGTTFHTADEHGATLTRVSFNPATGQGRPVAVLPATPIAAVGDTRPAEILDHLGYLYLSTRAGRDERTPTIPVNDMITVFHANPNSTRLLNEISTPGSKPRSMAAHGDTLFVAHERTNTIAEHALFPDGSVGSGRIVAHTGTPTSILHP